MPRKKNALLTAKELAAELRVSTDAVYQWVAVGVTPVEALRLGGTPEKPGRAIRFRRVDVERYLGERSDGHFGGAA